MEQGQRFKTLRQTVSLSRPATAKLLHVTLRTVHNWETAWAGFIAHKFDIADLAQNAIHETAYQANQG
jgi:hypothetical protein